MRWLRLDEPATALPALRDVLTEDELARVERYATPTLRRRALVRLARRRQLLAGAIGVEVAELQLTSTAACQPHLDGPRPLFVSAASHDALGVVAWSEDVAVGVDVEAIAELGTARGLPERVASPEELAALEALPEEARLVALARLWTRKEAYLKSTGEGIGAALRRTTVPLGELATPVRFEPQPGAAPCWCVELEVPTPGVLGALVVADGAGAPELRVAWG